MIQVSIRTPHLRFSEFKGDWELSRFEEAVTLQRGFDLTKANSVEGDFPVYSSSGISYYHNDFKVAGPGIITGRKGQIGAVHYCEGPYWPHDTTLWVKDFHGNSVAFTYWFLNQFNLTKYEASSSVPTLNRNNIHPIKIFFPSLPEQQKIAAFLSAVDKKIQQLQRKKELLEEYKKGVMQKIFSQEIRFKDEDGNDYPDWVEVPLREIVRKFIVPMRDKPIELSGPIPWCRIEDFNGKYLRASKSGQGVSLSTVKKMNLKVYPIDTLLVSCSANLGFCTITKTELVTNQTFIGLVPHVEQVDVEFLLYVMRLSARRLNILSSGTTISYLSRKQFEAFKIVLPSLTEQKQISNFISYIDLKIDGVDGLLHNVLLFKKGLLQQMFV